MMEPKVKTKRKKKVDVFIDWSKVEKAIADIKVDGDLTRQWLDTIALKFLKRQASKKELYEHGVDPQKGAIMIAQVDEETIGKIKIAIDFLGTAEKFGSIKPKELAMLQITEETKEGVDFSTLDVDKAVKRHDDWVVEFNILTREFTIRLGPEDERIIFRNGDDYLVELTSKKAMVEEGNEMGHCIGSHSTYNDKRVKGSAKFYSLRKNGESHVTFEIDTSSLNILQAQGKGNKPPVSKYLRSISEAIAFMNWNPGRLGLDRSGVIKGPDGRWYSIFDLPEEIGVEGETLSFPNISQIETLGNVKVIHGNFQITKCSDIETLGNLEEVKGDLIIEDCENFKNLGALKNVGGGLRVKNCPKFEALPRLERVGNYADFQECAQMETLGALKYVGGFLCLVGCTSLKKVEHLVEVGGMADFQDCSALTTLGKLKSVGEGIDLMGCVSLGDISHIETVMSGLEDEDIDGEMVVCVNSQTPQHVVDVFRNMGLKITHHGE